ncbi:LRR receptor-like serine/threonine-protein kinase FLS2 [Apium graveolens]|uniref:LRR receptor-like serine/threonine-protein kinase FLS2 n=1 Tax=Apium graveolens TaxID=4045 RepID=UPI003D7BABD8
MSIYLNLSYNTFFGTIPPEIGMLQEVQAIDISNTNLSGSINMLKGCRNLFTLDLSKNKLSGQIPTDTFTQLTVLTDLNLSSNQLDGPLPKSLASLRNLSSLDLSQNKFTGTIPDNFSSISTLKNLNLSFNQLEGRVPETGPFKNISLTSLQGNPSLCGGKFYNTCTNQKKSKGGLSRKTVIILASVGSFGVIMLLLLAILLFRRCTRKDQTKELEVAAPNYTSKSILKRFYPKELEDATNQFNEGNILGSSSMSTVYKGTLPNGQLIAVKNLKVHQFAATTEKSFNRELKTLGKLKHRNLVKLIGYAWESSRLKAIVLEFMENGSLETIIHDSGVDQARWTLSERIDVLVSIARGLAYLHSGYYFPIVHCDLKPSNVLFDGEWDVHVSDFGTARILDIDLNSSSSSSVSGFEGTIGYLAPEYAFMRKVTTKVDVFSFGVIVMEFLTRKRPTGLCQENGQPITLPRLVQNAFADGIERLLEAVDPQLVPDISEQEQLEKILKLALVCTCQEPEGRPDMDEVLSSLTKIRKLASQKMVDQRKDKPAMLPL